MNKFWKPFAELGTAFKDSFTVDIFTEARLKIALLYFVVGLVVLGVAGWIAYGHILDIVQGALQMVQQAVAQHNTIDQSTAAGIIAGAVDSEIKRLNLALGFWIVIALLLSAYILAGVTLSPIRRAMDKQRRFIADVAHELRTPLAVMKIDTEVLLMGGATASRQELLDTITSNLEEANRMAKITQFLLDFSHLESRLAKLELTRVNLETIVNDVVKNLTKLADEKGVTLTVRAIHAVTIKGDAIALGEMVTNLLKNAITYTPVGGTVSIGLWQRTYGGALLTVTDTGVGIPAEDIPRLFEPFYRGKDNVRTDHNAGLGLAIVKEIARIHQASISVDSTPGKGTSISIKFSPFTMHRG